MRKAFSCAVLLFYLFSFALIHAEDSKNSQTPQQRLDSALSRYKLTSETIKPWHLIAKVQLHDDHNKPSESGTIEEYFVSPTKYRVTYDLPDFHKSIIVNSQGSFIEGNHGSPPFGIRQTLQYALSPTLPAWRLKGAIPTPFTRQYGSLTLQCAMLKHRFDNGQDVPRGLFRTYCMDPNTGHLRMVSSIGGTTVIYSSIGAFQGNDVPLKLSLNEGEQNIVNLEIVNLEIAPNIDESLFKESSGAIASPERPVLPFTEVMEHVKEKKTPTSSSRMLFAGTNASVSVHLIIDRDGNVRDTELVGADTIELTVTAIKALQGWRFRPFIVHGEPTEIETTILYKYGEKP